MTYSYNKLVRCFDLYLIFFGVYLVSNHTQNNYKYPMLPFKCTLDLHSILMIVIAF